MNAKNLNPKPRTGVVQKSTNVIESIFASEYEVHLLIETPLFELIHLDLKRGAAFRLALIQSLISASLVEGTLSRNHTTVQAGTHLELPFSSGGGYFAVTDARLFCVGDAGTFCTLATSLDLSLSFPKALAKPHAHA